MMFGLSEEPVIELIRLFAEVLRQYDRRVVFAGLHAFHGLVGADERPAEPVVLLELADDLLARVEPPDQI